MMIEVVVKWVLPRTTIAIQNPPFLPISKRESSNSSAKQMPKTYMTIQSFSFLPPSPPFPSSSATVGRSVAALLATLGATSEFGPQELILPLGLLGNAGFWLLELPNEGGRVSPGEGKLPPLPEPPLVWLPRPEPGGVARAACCSAYALLPVCVLCLMPLRLGVEVG